MASRNVKLNLEKFHAAVLHIIGTCDSARLGAVKLHKVLYYSDMLWFIETGYSITGAEYRKRPFGPTCDLLLPVLERLEKSNIIKIDTVDYFGYNKKQFTLRGNSESNMLSSGEKAVLDEIIDFVCNNNSARSISDFSHDMVWDMVEYGETIPYYNAIHLIPNEVNAEAKKWASGKVKHFEGLGQKPSDATELGHKDVRALRASLAKLSERGAL